jgi:3-deoxy-7-phosphoheptulonate synthase
MIDASHANSSKKPENQMPVCADIAARWRAATAHRRRDGGIAPGGGAPGFGPGKELIYGQSVTDGCIDWSASVPVLENLAAAVKQRRLQGDQE